MSKRTETWLPWVMLFFLLLVGHIDELFYNDFDDLSVYRASAYISKFPHHPLLSRLNDHLQSHASALGAYRYERYRLRLIVPHGFLAQNVLVRIFEHLPLSSAYQSVFLAHLGLHLVARTAVFLAFGRLFRGHTSFVRLTFLLSLSPAIFSYPLYLGELFPFQHIGPSVLWSPPVPRGAALTFFFAALLFWCQRDNAIMSRTPRLTYMLLLGLASLLSHVSMGILMIGTTLLFSLVYVGLRLDPQALACRIGLWRFLLLFNGMWIALAILKLGYLLLHDAAELYMLAPASISTSTQLFKNIGKLTAWTLATNCLVFVWLRFRQVTAPAFTPSLGLSPRGGELRGVGGDRWSGVESSLLRAGDEFFRYLLPFSVISIGLNVFHPGKELWYGNLFLLTEACMRIVGVTHLLWWMVFGIFLWARFLTEDKNRWYPYAYAILLVLCVTTTLQLWHRAYQSDATAVLFDQEHLTLQSSVLLTRSWADVYADEALYFQALANELRQKNVASQ